MDNECNIACSRVNWLVREIEKSLERKSQGVRMRYKLLIKVKKLVQFRVKTVEIMRSIYIWDNQR